MSVLRLDLGGITATAPRLSSSTRSQSASNALSPSSAPKTRPVISGATPTRSWRWPGRSVKRTRFPPAVFHWLCQWNLDGLRPGRPPARRPWSSARRASARWPDAQSPFCAARLLVGGAGQGSARVAGGMPAEGVTIVPSIRAYSKSGSPDKRSKMRSKRPARTQRRKRLNTLFQRPNPSGRSRHGEPVRTRHSTASRNSRLSRAVTPDPTPCQTAAGQPSPKPNQ